MPEERKFYLTKEGLERIKKEYKDLRELRMAKAKGEVPKILQSEDVNPEYFLFQEDIDFLESRITELDYILKNAELIKVPSKDKQNIVDMGATVTSQEPDGSLNEFMIVGTLETNPSGGRISSESPVGKALMGHKVGEEIVITSPIKGSYKIKEIKYQLS